MEQSSAVASDVDVKDRCSISVWTANLVGIPFLGCALAVFVGLHGWIWEVSVFEAALAALEAQPWFGVLFLGGIAVHEGIHALAMRYVAGVPWSQIKGGIKWKLLTPYVHTSHVMTAGVYRVVALSPGVILGLVPAGVGLATGSMIWTLFGALFAGVAGGDVLSVWRLRGVRSTAWVRDASDRCGCDVVVSDGEQTGAAASEPVE